MRGLTIISRVVIIIMTVCGLRILLQHSLGHGASFDIFLAGAPSPWQTFINQDLVSGLFIVLPWMIYREQGSRPIDIFCWSWMVLWWGNIIVAIYALVALRQSHGDAARMFAGRRAGSLAPVWTAPGMAIRALLILSALAILIYMALLIQQAAEAIAIIGAIFGLAPVALSFLLLAFPASGDKTRAAA